MGCSAAGANLDRHMMEGGAHPGQCFTADTSNHAETDAQPLAPANYL